MLRAPVFLLKHLHNSGKARRLLSEAKLPAAAAPAPSGLGAGLQPPCFGSVQAGAGEQGGDSGWKYIGSA